MGKIIDTLKGLIPSGGQLLNFGSSIASLIGRNKNIDKQLNAQKEENQKNRDFNLMLAQMQNEWNQNQWERENEYDSPVNQMKRFKEAGLNPDLIYGQGTSGNAMQLSGGLTAGAPSSPTDFTALGQKMTLGDAIRSSLDTEMQQAQIDAIRANTKKTLSETEGQNYSNEILKSDAKFRDAINQGNIDTGNMNIALGNTTINEKNENITKIRKECSILDQNLTNLKHYADLIKQKIENVRLDNVLKVLDSQVHEKRTQAYIENLMASANLSRKSAHRITYLLTAEYLGLKAQIKHTNEDTELLKKVGVNYDAQTQKLEVETGFAKQDHTFNKTMRVVDAVVNGVGAVVNGIGMVYGVGTIGKALSTPRVPSPSTGSLGYPYN